MPPTREQLDAVDEKCRVDAGIVCSAIARVPPSWSFHERAPSGGVFTRGSLQVILSVMRYEDGNIWLHVSVCGRTGQRSYYLPSWEELKRVKNDFIGEDRWAYQVLPSSKAYVNHNAYVLHLFSLFEGGRPALPDFTWGLGTL